MSGQLGPEVAPDGPAAVSTSRLLAPRVATNLGAVIVFSLVMLALGAVQLVASAIRGDSVPMAIELPDVGGMLAGQPVTVRGAAVGLVNGTRLTRDGVEVVLDVQRDREVPRHAVVQILRRSPLGEQAIDLTPVPPDWEPPADGTRILASKLPAITDWPTLDLTASEALDIRGVVLPASVPDVLERTDDLLTTVDVPSLVTVLEELGTALDGRVETLRRITRDGADLARTLHEGSDDLERLLDASGPVLELVRDQRDTLAAGLRSSTTLTEVLAERGDDLRTTLASAPAAFDEVSRLLAEQAPNLSCLNADLLRLSRMVAAPGALADLARLLDFQRYFFGSFDGGSQWDPARPNAFWARVNFLLMEQGTAVANVPKTPTPPTLPGAACTSPFGPGVDAVRQPDAGPPDPTSPGVDLAPRLRGAGDRADHELLPRPRVSWAR